MRWPLNDDQEYKPRYSHLVWYSDSFTWKLRIDPDYDKALNLQQFEEDLAIFMYNLLAVTYRYNWLFVVS